MTFLSFRYHVAVLFATCICCTDAAVANASAATSAEFFNIAAAPTSSSASQLAFYMTLGEDLKGVWPYLVTVKNSDLSKTETTTSLLTNLFGSVPAYNVLDSQHVQVFASPSQLPTDSKITEYIRSNHLPTTGAIEALPYGALVGIDITSAISVTNSSAPALLITQSLVGIDLTDASNAAAKQIFEDEMIKQTGAISATFSYTTTTSTRRRRLQTVTTKVEMFAIFNTVTDLAETQTKVETDLATEVKTALLQDATVGETTFKDVAFEAPVVEVVKKGTVVQEVPEVVATTTTKADTDDGDATTSTTTVAGDGRRLEFIPQPSETAATSVRLLVTLHSGVDSNAFITQTTGDLASTTTLSSLKNVRDYAYANADDTLLRSAFLINPPASRFGTVTFAASNTNNRVAVNVNLKGTEDSTAALLYLAFYMINQHSVAFVTQTPTHYALATRQASFIDDGIYIEGKCDSVRYHNLNGQGEFIGLADTGLDLTSSYLFGVHGPACSAGVTECGGVAGETNSFELQETSDPAVSYSKRARVVVRYDTNADNVEAAAEGHGTFLAGVIAGSANPSKAYTQCYDEPAKTAKHVHAEGVAVAAKLAFYDIGDGASNLNPPVGDYSKMFAAANSIGAQVFTVAFGEGTNGPNYSGMYSSSATDIDTFMASNNNALVVVAAGNGHSSLVTSPAISKNAITVGSAAGSGSAVSSFSSGGRQPDGRKKPDVVAIGEHVYSAASRGTTATPEPSHCGVTEQSGTSIATALVSGAAAMVRQYFRTGQNPGTEGNDASLQTDLWGSTVKAVLVTASVPLAGTSKAGFGAVVLGQVLPFEDDNLVDLQVYQETIAHSEEIVKTVTVQSEDQPLIVSLAWTDPVAANGARNVVINDVELVVSEASSGKTWSTTITPQPGNVKRIFIKQPSKGIHTITVKGKFVIDSQKVSLVVSGVFSDVDRSEPICCAAGSFVGVGGCLSIDALICIIFAAIIVVVIIVASIYLCCRQRSVQAAKAKEQEKDEIHPL